MSKVNIKQIFLGILKFEVHFDWIKQKIQVTTLWESQTQALVICNVFFHYFLILVVYVYDVKIKYGVKSFQMVTYQSFCITSTTNEAAFSIQQNITLSLNLSLSL